MKLTKEELDKIFNKIIKIEVYELPQKKNAQYHSECLKRFLNTELIIGIDSKDKDYKTVRECFIDIIDKSIKKMKLIIDYDEYTTYREKLDKINEIAHKKFHLFYNPISSNLWTIYPKNQKEIDLTYIKGTTYEKELVFKMALAIESYEKNGQILIKEYFEIKDSMNVIEVYLKFYYILYNKILNMD